MFPGVLPNILLASEPTAKTSPVWLLTATTDGSLNTIPFPFVYAITVAVISFIAYVVAGFTQKLGIIPCAIISWVVALVILFGFLFLMKVLQNKKANAKE